MKATLIYLPNYSATCFDLKKDCDRILDKNCTLNVKGAYCSVHLIVTYHHLQYFCSEFFLFLFKTVIVSVVVFLSLFSNEIVKIVS